MGGECAHFHAQVSRLMLRGCCTNGVPLRPPLSRNVTRVALRGKGTQQADTWRRARNCVTLSTEMLARAPHLDAHTLHARITQTMQTNPIPSHIAHANATAQTLLIGLKLASGPASAPLLHRHHATAVMGPSG